jgi:hypothetical protein
MMGIKEILKFFIDFIKILLLILPCGFFVVYFLAVEILKDIRRMIRRRL